MPDVLENIEVNNFKSYKGQHSIGTLKPFTAVIGPNGSGKSNFMDAISFAMGEKTSSLRVGRASDLIHGATINKAAADSTSVTAVFKMDNGASKKFTRSLEGGKFVYRINNEIVTRQRYMDSLETIGVNVKAKNFLVFQGAIESIAMKSPKEITVLFEEISGSGALKTEYDRLKAEVTIAEKEANSFHLKKKVSLAESKEAKLEHEEAKRYKKLQEELAKKQIEYQLFRLYHNKIGTNHYVSEMKIRRKDLKQLERMIEEAEKDLKRKKIERGKINMEISKIDQCYRETEVEMIKLRPSLIKSNERTLHLEEKLKSTKKSLAEAKRANEAHERDMQELQAELEEVEARRLEYEDQVTGESQSQGRDLLLEASQVVEYKRIKLESQKQSASYLQELDSISREQKAEQDELDNQARITADIARHIQHKTQEKLEALKHADKLNDMTRKIVDTINDQKRLREELQSDIQKSKDCVQELQKELKTVNDRLGEAKIEHTEYSRLKQKEEVIKNFKQIFSGVYDRMINLCQPMEKKYNLAVTKVFGKYMDAVVVDTMDTAKLCIQFLKDKQLTLMTFLPLDSIMPKAENERLRKIEEPKNVKMIYDILYFPLEIDRAVHFVTNNVLLCDTPEDAMKVSTTYRANVVSLDGTFFRKSGIISGGKQDLAKKARCWDNKIVSLLKTTKDNMTKELQEAMINAHKESELNAIDNQIRGLQSQLKFTKTDRTRATLQLTALDEKLRQLEGNMELISPRLERIQQSMMERSKLLKEIKTKINRVEDNLFKDFCSAIGIKNIRQYEENELRSHQERENNRLEFENQKNRIMNQLEFERTKDTKRNINRWELAVCDQADELGKARMDEKMEIYKTDKLKRELERKEKEKKIKKMAVEKIEEQIIEARKKIAAIEKDSKPVKERLLSIESKLELLRNERNNIIMHCKVEDIQIPMIQGSVEDLLAYDSSNLDDSSSAAEAQIYVSEARMKVDYSELSASYKTLKNHEVKKHREKLAKAIRDASVNLQKVQAPNMKAIKKLETARENLSESTEDFENARLRAQEARKNFETVKRERRDKFMDCFEHVSNEIDSIYKNLTKDQSAQALLGAENPEEPYLAGINYSCLAPGKRFLPMIDLSGAEKTIAALALLFAMHSHQPAPFFVLDEIDAALDKTNIGKVASYINSMKHRMQTIVISLHEEFFSYADALIGVIPKAGDCTRSKVVALDISCYPKGHTNE